MRFLFTISAPSCYLYQTKREGPCCRMENGSTSIDVDRPWQFYHTVYTNAKAGMDGVDKEKVQRIVYEMSKGSKYFKNEERKDAYIRQKIENMRQQCAKLTTSDISHYQIVAQKRILELEAARELSRIWMHVDMDAFYAAVETLSNPSLKGKPVAVGSMSMISTANYEARRYGVRAAMPGFIACRLCPSLILVPVDFKKYSYYSDLTRKVFQNYDANFMATSLDEAYLDITELCRTRGVTSGEIVEELRRNVYQETGLTCSAGVAPNRLLAKVCSDINKPNGQFVLPNDQMAVMTLVSTLPIRKIGGIGKVTEHILRDAFEINTCGDLLKKSGFLCALFSGSSADFFLSVGLGIGKADAPEVKLRKSISNERTFSATDNKDVLHHKLVDLAETLSSEMQREGLCGRTLTLKLKTASFEVRTRAITLQKYICSKVDILNYASKLLKAELPSSLRLIGLRISHLNEEKLGVQSDPTQRTLANFIVSRDRSAEHVDGDSCLDSEHGGKDNHGSWDLLDSSHSVPADAWPNSCTSDNNCVEQANTSDDSASKSYQTEISERENLSDNCSLSKDKMNEELSWVDGYKCSSCGIELPPSFVDERQEHFDYHLAEKLQKEESGPNSRNSFLTRLNSKSHIGTKSKQKKRKSCSKEGKHLPIDIFFDKSNQD